MRIGLTTASGTTFIFLQLCGYVPTVFGNPEYYFHSDTVARASPLQTRKSFMKKASGSVSTHSSSTFFDPVTSQYLQKDSANPLDGYSLSTLLPSHSDGSSNTRCDINGALYDHVLTNLRLFSEKLRTQSHSFVLLGADAFYLPIILRDSPVAKRGFDRIEVSNVADTSYLGPEIVLSTFGPMLKTTKDNPHATLITRFMNATRSAEQDLGDLYRRKAAKKGIKKTRKLLPACPVPVEAEKYDPQLLRLSAAASMYKDRD